MATPLHNAAMTTSRPRSLAGGFAGALGHDVADRRIDILRRVGQCGSISQAAREAGVSYKAAWQAIDTLTNLAGVPLVERSVGGSGGGGARITTAGEHLLQAADALAAARQTAGGDRLPAGLQLRTSMRNQLPVTVARLKTAGRIVEVTLALADGTHLASRITRESAELLGLASGLAVLALCKATAVGVQPGALPALGHANALAGVAARVSRGKSGDEVSLTLPGGLQLVGFAAAGSGVRKGDAVWALVEPSAVVIALPG
jgi:molybdate transport system regulatory protein